MNEMPTAAPSHDDGQSHLQPSAANYVPLSPISFLRRAARVFPGKIAVTHHDRSWTYTAFADRCRRFAGGLLAAGIKPGDSVAVLAPNGPTALEAHYGVPLMGGVICAINTLMDAGTIAFILDHAGCRALIADRDYAPRVRDALARFGRDILLIQVADEAAPDAEDLGAPDYEDWLDQASPAPWRLPADEWDTIAINYTSGTTGNPKGVVYHHRGAYLGALGSGLSIGLNADSRYLWTLPMFHCSGWTFTWGVTAVGGTHVCLRKVGAGAIFDKIARHKVTHLCGAPIVLNMLVHANDAEKRPLPGRVVAATGGAAPPSPIIAGMERLGFRIQHVYGLTECYGPSITCEPQDEWQDLPLDERARLMARQGVPNITEEDVTVLDEAGQCVPADGETLGEIAMRDNVIMKGYLKNPDATQQIFRNGWFLTGDLGVLHPDSYIEVKDRSKDIIISGGENISSLEVEEVLYRHPAVLEAAVVAKPDEKWGEIPCAFIVTKTGQNVSAADLTAFCRSHMAHFKIPKLFIFEALPKTATGKIQKNQLRAKAKAAKA